MQWAMGFLVLQNSLLIKRFLVSYNYTEKIKYKNNFIRLIYLFFIT